MRAAGVDRSRHRKRGQPWQIRQALSPVRGAVRLLSSVTVHADERRTLRLMPRLNVGAAAAVVPAAPRAA